MLCAECVGRSPLSEPLTWPSLFQTFWTMFKRMGGWVLLLRAITSLPIVALQVASRDAFEPDVLATLLPMVVGAVCTRMAVVQAVSGGALQFGDALSLVGKRFFVLLLASLGMWLLAFLFALCFLIPGLMWLLSCSLVTAIAVCDPIVVPWEVLALSRARMRGHRWVALVGYGSVYAVGSAAGALVTAALAGRSVAASVTLVPALAAAVSSTLSGIAALLSAALYVRLTPPDLWPLGTNDEQV
jgi:hypothetical protein